MNKINAFELVLLAHRCGAVSTETGVNINGAEYKLRGQSNTVLQLDVPVIVLLSEDSTPQDTKVAENASGEFEKAVRALVKEGKHFYTVLRTEWALPALLWSVSGKPVTVSSSV